MSQVDTARVIRGGQSIPSQAGVALCTPHLAQVIRERPQVPWFEVHAENLMYESKSLIELAEVAKNYPLSLHAVGLSLGSSNPPDQIRLGKLAQLIGSLEPGLVSDHLSWTEASGIHLPDLFPLPYSWEALRVVARNVQIVQEALRRPILIENLPRYFEISDCPIDEYDFVAELVLRTGCGVLLNIANLYVSACARGLSPTGVLYRFLGAIDASDIKQIHLAGPSNHEESPASVASRCRTVETSIWALFERAVEYLGPRPTVFESHAVLPSLEVLLEECAGVEEVLSGHVARRRVV
jgi:uncharacterized protein